MMIIKDTIHPQNSPDDVIYPKTSIDQVEGLNDALNKYFLHRIKIQDSENGYFVNIGVYCKRSTKFNNIAEVSRHMWLSELSDKKPIRLSAYYKVTINGKLYYGEGSVVLTETNIELFSIVSSFDGVIKVAYGTKSYNDFVGFDDDIFEV